MALAEELLVVEDLDRLTGVQVLHLVRRLAVAGEDLIEVRDQQEAELLLPVLTLMLLAEMWTSVPSIQALPTVPAVAAGGGVATTIPEGEGEWKDRQAGGIDKSAHDGTVLPVPVPA